MRIEGCWLLAASLLAAGCGTALGGGDRSRGADIEEMKRRVVELQRQARVAEVELERLRRQVAALEAALEAGARAPEAAPSPAAERPRPTPPAVLEPDRQRVEASDLAAGGEPVVRRRPPPVEPEPASEPVSADAQAIYDRGYTLYHQGRYVDAETGFRQFLQAHPDTELADNAQYWIGEARFARGDVPGALAAFRETVERFPAGNKVPDAHLKIGDCLERLGDLEGARAQYAEVVRRYPETAAAAMAEERRAQLP